MDRRSSWSKLFGLGRKRNSIHVEQANFDFRTHGENNYTSDNEGEKIKSVNMENIMLYLLPVVIIFAVIVIC